MRTPLSCPGVLSLCELRCKESWQDEPTTIGELILKPRDGQECWGFNTEITLSLRVGNTNVLEAPHATWD